jgi:hypothetical protein
LHKPATVDCIRSNAEAAQKEGRHEAGRKVYTLANCSFKPGSIPVRTGVCARQYTFRLTSIFLE